MTLFSKLKHVKDLRSKAKQLQNVLAEENVESAAAWGKIKIVISGNQEVQSISIDPEMLNNKEKLEESLKEAFNSGLKKVQKIMVEKMKNMPDLNFPGLT